MNDKELALELWRIGAIKIKEKGGWRIKLHKKYPNAPLTPIYIDLRLLRSCPALKIQIAWRIIRFVYEVRQRPDLLADIPTSATPVVSTISDLTGIPMISPRPEKLKGKKKSYGPGNVIDGNFIQGQNVMLIDDVVSAFAASKLAAIKTLTEAGLIVNHWIVVIVDRNEGGYQVLAKCGYQLCSVLDFHQILSYYLDEGKINKTIYDRVINFMHSMHDLSSQNR